MSGVKQALGAVGGVVAIMEVIPPKYRHMIGGPTLKVDLHTGAVAEGVLTFAITFAVLFIVLRGPRSELMKTWLMAMSTVALIVAGSAYTGPAMNPAFVSCYQYFSSLNWFCLLPAPVLINYYTSSYHEGWDGARKKELGVEI